MQDIKLLLYILSSLGGITLILIGYIIKTKDATEKATKEILKELTNLVTTLTNNMVLLKVELENNVHNTRKHDELIIKLSDFVANIRVAEARMSGRISATEKDVVELKKGK